MSTFCSVQPRILSISTSEIWMEIIIWNCQKVRLYTVLFRAYFPSNNFPLQQNWTSSGLTTRWPLSSKKTSSIMSLFNTWLKMGGNLWSAKMTKKSILKIQHGFWKGLNLLVNGFALRAKEKSTSMPSPKPPKSIEILIPICAIWLCHSGKIQLIEYCKKISIVNKSFNVTFLRGVCFYFYILEMR